MAELNAPQLETIKRFLVEYRNFPGAKALAKKWSLSQEELDRILKEVLREAAEKGVLKKKQFDIETMRYLSLEEWLMKHLKEKGP
jgi:predicted NAD/FAD-binding protein